MLTIRREQMQTFARQSERDFETRAVEHLASENPHALRQRGSEGLLALVRETLDWTRDAGLDSEIGVVVCAGLSLRHGPDFHMHETWARDALAHGFLTHDERVERLSRHLGSRNG